MKRRYLIVAGSLAACACLTLGVLAMMPAPPGVTKANFDRIQKGMMRADVDEIFGGQSAGGSMSMIVVGGVVIRFESWQNDDGSRASVSFFNGQVSDMQWANSTESITEKLRRWLRLPWRQLPPPNSV